MVNWKREIVKIDPKQNSLMWEMFDDDIECDECGGPGPPPKFLIPPPPRPPFMQELTKCSDEENINTNSDFYYNKISDNSINNNNNNNNMCEAIPILDASFHSSPSLQTSAMIAVFSLLLVLVVLISSLFVWKHKRKVQNFLPCKTPTRGGHLSGGVTGGHSVTYEDPDAHLGHRPLVMRHHHNVEMIHPKSIHYPSGYPMTRSPPLFVCSSPGPDPYRSNDNVYEELGPARDSDNESEPPLHSDDDFAEDELSLPGERSFNKSSPDATSTAPVATIYHERISSNNSTSGQERNSLLSSSSSTTNNELRNGILSGVIRQASGCGLGIGRKTHHNLSSASNSIKNNSNNVRKISNFSADEFNNSSEQTGSDIVPTVYDERNLVSLAYNNCNNSSSNNNNSFSNDSSNNISNNRYTSSSNPGVLLTESEVERRNRINNQLHHPPPVSTIFRGERITYNTSRFPQPHYSHHSLLSSHQSNQRSRTNPRSLDRRRIGIPIDHDPNYGYAEPVFHEALLYDGACLAHPNSNSLRTTHPYPYILPEYTSFSRTLGNNTHHHHLQQQQQSKELLQPQPTAQQIFSRDSSFGSDSGYSHHTQASSGRSANNGIGATGGNLVLNNCRTNTSVNNSSNGSKLGLNFGWNRRPNKDNSTNNNHKSTSNNSSNINNNSSNNPSSDNTNTNVDYENS